MTAQQKIDKILEIKKLEFNEFAMECKILPNSLKVAVNRNSLGPDIVKKIHDRFGVRKEFLKTGREPIFPEQSDEKHTHAQNETAVTENAQGGINPVRVLQEVLEEESDYRIIPKTILDGEYRIFPKSELDLRAQEVEERKRERQETIDAKNALIKVLEEEIAELRAKIASSAQQAH